METVRKSKKKFPDLKDKQVGPKGDKSRNFSLKSPGGGRFEKGF